MATRIIECHVKDEYVVGAGVAVGAAGSHDDVFLRLHFGELWRGLSKSITWLNALGGNPTVTLLTADMAEDVDTYVAAIPFEAKEYEGEMAMSIKGATVSEDIETRATMSVTARYLVLPSCYDNDAAESQDITPTQAEQLQGEIDAVLQNVLDAEAYAVGKRAGVDVPSTDVAYHNNSKYYSEQSAASDQDAQHQALYAEAYADAAQGWAASAHTYEISAAGSAALAQAAQTASEAAQAAAEAAQDAIENMTVSASEAAEVSVSKTISEGIVNLAFGLKRGPKGDTGSPAGFGTVSASVDDQMGIPSVEVTTSGPKEAKNITFNFHNLRGQPGDVFIVHPTNEYTVEMIYEAFSAGKTVYLVEDVSGGQSNVYIPSLMSAYAVAFEGIDDSGKHKQWTRMIISAWLETEIINTLRYVSEGNAEFSAKWGVHYDLGRLHSNVEISLPSTSVVYHRACESSMVFEANSSYTVTLTAGPNVKITDGENTGSSLVLSNLTSGSYYEISLAVLDTLLIAAVIKEWP